MGAYVDADDLVAAVDIAARAGLVPSTVQRWARLEGYMPAPVAIVNDGLTKLWSWREVAAWLERPVSERPGTRSRWVYLDDLLSATEIAALLGWADVGTATRQWLHGTFPAPVVDKSRLRLWLREDVDRWAATANRRPSLRRSSD